MLYDTQRIAHFYGQVLARISADETKVCLSGTKCAKSDARLKSLYRAKTGTGVLCLVFVLLVACNHKKDDKEHWDYHGEHSPDHWVEIGTHSKCGARQQSPINIVESETVHTDVFRAFELYYSPKIHLKKVENNGHSIQFNLEYGDSIFYEGEFYHLKQIHFHEPSEHQLNGENFPIEMHLVHENKAGHITVLGLFGVDGKESELFEFFTSFLPIRNGASKEIDEELHLEGLSLGTKEYYTYTGSLTTPPCTEHVNWLIFKEPMIVSLLEIRALRDNMPLNNKREVKELNERVVYDVRPY